MGLQLKFKPIEWPLTAYCFNKSSNNEGQYHEKKTAMPVLYYYVNMYGNKCNDIKLTVYDTDVNYFLS